MSNYTLTTDLIADCMALIPENLERIIGNNIFAIEVNRYNNYYDKEPYFTFYDEGEDFGHKTFFDLPTRGQKEIIILCLQTIPEFQLENPEYYAYNDITYQEDGQHLCTFPDDKYTADELCNLTASSYIIFKTIASATLHGQGEFPPSTLEELCESYKNVMSK